MLGFLNLNKPPGLTSHDCVAKVRRLLKTRRVGHGGTLDPLATGVLPIAVGKATRLFTFLPTDKVYQAKIRLGIQTTTDDLEGEVIKTAVVPEISKEEIEPLLKQFEGKIEQIPPIYSAIGQGGKRLYQLARAGEKVEAPARTVQIDRIEIKAIAPGKFPEIEAEIACGPGTYIRAIARDLGASLGVGGTLAALTRTRSCGFNLENSLSFAEIETALEQGNFALVAPDVALQNLPAVTLDATEAKRWCQGQKIALNQDLQTDWVKVLGEDKLFLGIARISREDTNLWLYPKVVLN